MKSDIIRSIKKIFAVTLAGAILCGTAAFAEAVGFLGENIISLNVRADNLHDIYFYTENDDGSVTITGLDVSVRDLVIPSQLDGKPVSGIGDYAFSGDSVISNVTIPNGVKSIGTGAFVESKLTGITIPDSVTNIGRGAFENCKALTSITIPDGITIIGDGTFSGCTGLTSITIPNSVRIISGAFTYCTGLTSITIPDSVTEIGGAFEGCTGLTSITIPDSVTGIGCAFEGCTGLTSVTIGDGVTSIEGAFQNCTGLTSITIPDSVTNINAAFGGCTGLTSVTIPDGVTNINAAFRGCTGLTSINIPDGVTEIGDGTFSGCRGLTSVTIPESVTSIGNYAFRYCSGLAEITIPESVTSIGTYAFAYCPNLKSVKIPASVTKIGKLAFAYYYDDNWEEDCIMPGFVIYGAPGTAAETYANHYGITFTTPDVAVTSVELDKASANICIGELLNLIATIAPSNATNKTITWTTSDSSVATVSNGKVTAVGAGTAAITATTINNMTATCTVTVYAKAIRFIDGADNWSFSNSKENFGNTYYMNDTYWNALVSGLSNTEKSRMKEYVKKADWQGSCYGMASTSILASNYILRPGTYQTGANFLHDISKPPTNEVKSLINYYFALQNTDVIQQKVCENFYNDDEKVKLQFLLQCLEDGSPTLLCFHGYFYGNQWGGHAVVAYDVEYGTYSYNRKAYNGKIVTYDNNNIDYYDDFCLYFNSSDGSWTIPYYELDSSKGSLLGFVTDDMKYVNYHGYLNGTSDVTVTDYIAVLHSAALSGNYKLTKANLSNGTWISTTTADDDIKVFSSFADSNFENCDLMFAMKDASSGYILKTSDTEKIDLSLSYENSLLIAESDKGKTAKFSPNGCVEINGDNTSYRLGMTFNSGYPTDWYAVEVSGENANTATLKKSNEGYIISSDNLEGTKIRVNNSESEAAAKFSTTYDSVLIYEIDGSTIGLRVDTDNNGTYETELDVEIPLTNTSTINSDTISLGQRIYYSGDAEGGTAPYTYSYYYKRESGKVWKTLGRENTDMTSIAFAPTALDVYDVKIVVTDAGGSTAEKTYKVTVVDGKSKAFSNDSTISTTGGKLGTKVRVYGAASGSDGYTYAYYYKRTTARLWKVLGTEFGTAAAAQFTPTDVGDFNVRVDVKDKNGEIVSRNFAVTISNDYVDTTTKLNVTASSTYAPAGTRITVTASATDGTAPYQYAFYYKRAEGNSWNLVGTGYSETPYASVKFKTAGDIIFKVCVKDANGGMTSKNIDVEITE